MSDKEETKKQDASADLSAMLGIGGLFDGVSNLITKFGELAEKEKPYAARHIKANHLPAKR